MFKVVPDQLKISDGWVRCGHCADVFDATLYLEAWAPPAPAPAGPMAAESHWPSAATPTETPAEAPRPDEDSLARAAETQRSDGETIATSEPPATGPADPGAVAVSDWLPLTDGAAKARERDDDLEPIWPAAASQPEVPVGFQPEHTAAAALVPPVEPSPQPELRADGPQAPTTSLDSATDFQTELERFAAASASASGRQRHDLASTPEAVPSGFNEPLADDAAPLDEPGFVREARRQARWRSPGVRAALGVLGVLLGVLLAAQWVLHERDRLAASHPDLAPLLARLCEPLGCDIGPVQRIDAVVIDSSSLVRRLGNFYSFDLVLKNTAAMAVAVPALELTLTDSSDRVIARRVFLQQELPGTPELLPAQGNLALSLRLSINDVGAVPMAGYRALVFYP
jgi:predicted Zn finger-like uncharacterized protein